MITVAGEALIDVIVNASGSLTGFPGGAPFNVARTVARLGAECQFVGRLSEDPFGDRLAVSLLDAAVDVVIPQRSPAPTTLAFAQLDDTGSADYRFYLEGTSAAQLTPEQIPLEIPGDSVALALGGLGLVIEPICSTLNGLIARTPPAVTIALDPNCRPRAISDLGRYRRSMAALLPRVDIVKVSIEDLGLLTPALDRERAAAALLARGPAAVIVSDGPRPVTVHCRGGRRIVPVANVEVVDTVGAGDAFVAGLLAWWSSRRLSRADAGDLDALAEAAHAAAGVASAACTVRGADLPDSTARLFKAPLAADQCDRG
ncbi:MAG: carbohydrate kinase family protein [Solirubrobacteraceae bacterium]